MTDPEHVYYNIAIRNTTNLPRIAAFTETRTTTLLDKPSDYKLAITRFYIPGSLIPIFDFPDPAGPTQLWVTVDQPIGGGGLSFSVQVGYVPDDLSGVSGVNRPVITFNQFLFGVNAAIAAAVVAAGVASTPQMYYNETNQLFYLRAEAADWDPVTPYSGGLSARLWFNSNLQNYFQSMYGLQLGYDRADRRDFQVYVQNLVNNVVSIGPTVLDMPTELNTQYLWPDLERILFLTNNIPVIPEFHNATDGATVWKKIVTDFEPLNTGDFRTNDVFQYQAPIYRYIDLNQDTPLREIDLGIFWQSRNGNVYPLMIPPHRDVNIKILFEKKKTCC